jgi:hypothetical protein
MSIILNETLEYCTCGARQRPPGRAWGAVNAGVGGSFRQKRDPAGWMKRRGRADHRISLGRGAVAMKGNPAGGGMFRRARPRQRKRLSMDVTGVGPRRPPVRDESDSPIWQVRPGWSVPKREQRPQNRLGFYSQKPVCPLSRFSTPRRSFFLQTDGGTGSGWGRGCTEDSVVNLDPKKLL